jgi:hypothetical protein
MRGTVSIHTKIISHGAIGSDVAFGIPSSIRLDFVITGWRGRLRDLNILDADSRFAGKICTGTVLDIHAVNGGDRGGTGWHGHGPDKNIVFFFFFLSASFLGEWVRDANATFAADKLKARLGVLIAEYLGTVFCLGASGRRAAAPAQSAARRGRSDSGGDKASEH